VLGRYRASSVILAYADSAAISGSSLADIWRINENTASRDFECEVSLTLSNLIDFCIILNAEIWYAPSVFLFHIYTYISTKPPILPTYTDFYRY